MQDKETDWISINTAQSDKIHPFSIAQYGKIEAFQLKTPALTCRGTHEFWSGSNPRGYVNISK